LREIGSRASVKAYIFIEDVFEIATHVAIVNGEGEPYVNFGASITVK
jgi:hypothetical protein